MAANPQATKAVVSIIVIVLAVGFIFWWRQKQKAGRHGEGRDREVLAIEVLPDGTGKAVKVIKPQDKPWPLEGRRYKAYSCLEEGCESLFPATPGQMAQTCPICKRQNTGAAEMGKKNWSVRVPDDFLESVE